MKKDLDMCSSFIICAKINPESEKEDEEEKEKMLGNVKCCQ